MDTLSLLMPYDRDSNYASRVSADKHENYQNILPHKHLRLSERSILL